MKKKFKDVLESALLTTKDRFQPLLELYEELGDMPVDPVAAPPADLPADDKPSSDYMAHLGEMVKAICMDDAMTPDQKSDKIMAAIKVMEETKEKPVAEGEGEGEATGATETEAKESAECAGKTADAKAALESREKEELAQLRSEKKVRDVCESFDFAPTPLQIKALATLSDADRKAFVKELKTAAGKAPAKTNTTPRTATGRGVNVQESVSAGSRTSIDFSDNSPEAIKKRAAYFKN